MSSGGDTKGTVISGNHSEAIGVGMQPSIQVFTVEFLLMS